MQQEWSGPEKTEDPRVHRAKEFAANHLSRSDYARIAGFVDLEIDLISPPAEVPSEERNELVRFLQLHFDKLRACSE